MKTLTAADARSITESNKRLRDMLLDSDSSTLARVYARVTDAARSGFTAVIFYEPLGADHDAVVQQLCGDGFAVCYAEEDRIVICW